MLADAPAGPPVESIGDLAGLGRTEPLLALAFAVFMFSMAGIPPLAGFFGKLYVFLAAVEPGWHLAGGRSACWPAWSAPTTTCASSR